MASFSDSPIDRRKFMAVATSATAALALPGVVTANKSGSAPTLVGEGEHQYQVVHDWPQLPEKYHWQTTHNVASDSAGNVYVIHEGNEKLTDHPSLFVFDSEGKFIRAFGQQFQGGGHGLEVRKEGSEEFLYVSAYKALKTFAKLTLEGETVWQRMAPMEAGMYAPGEDTNPQGNWGRDRFMPTNFAFVDDGGFFVADGYGSYYIHRYDKEANWVLSFGGPGKEDGKFDTPHGIWIDRRGDEPTIVVSDRANHRLQWFTLEGQHLRTQDGFYLPANCDTYGDLLLVPDLEARVTLLDKDNKVAAQLGGDPEWHDKVMDNNRQMRGRPKQWVDGRFVHPHDACFDRDGSIFVAEWVATGRISKLTKVS
jgi:hypothetical protein